MQKKTISFINWDKRVKKAYELNHLKNWYSIKPSWSRSLGWLNSGFSPFLAMGFCFSFTLVRRIFIIDNSSHLIWNSMFIYGSSAIISTALLGWPPCTHDYRDFMSVLNHSNKYSCIPEAQLFSLDLLGKFCADCRFPIIFFLCTRPSLGLSLPLNCSTPLLQEPTLSTHGYAIPHSWWMIHQILQSFPFSSFSLCKKNCWLLYLLDYKTINQLIK